MKSLNFDYYLSNVNLKKPEYSLRSKATATSPRPEPTLNKSRNFHKQLANLQDYLNISILEECNKSSERIDLSKSHL